MALMNPSPDAAMNVQVSGKQMDVGEAFRTRATDDLIAGIGKYFERGGSAEVTVRKDGHQFCVDIIAVLASGQQVVAYGVGGDAHAAFDNALTKIEKRVRRYKRRLTNHHPHLGGPRSPAETAPLVVPRGTDEDDELGDDDWGHDGSAGNGAPAAMIIAETESPVKTQTVSMAVMDLDLTDTPVVVFRNVAHGGISVVYRRSDGNIGWIDPERTRPGSSEAETRDGPQPQAHA
jgi:ribosomal subunit interface protein